jgi:CBS domain-containing protein
MKVRDAMNSSPSTISASSSLQQAADLLAKVQAADLMVVDPDGTFLGVLSEGDLVRATLPRLDELLSQGEGMGAAGDIFEDKAKNLRAKTVETCMIKDAISVAPGDDLVKAAGLMGSRNIRRLPVVDGKRLVGTVSRADVCHAILRD